MSKTSNDSGGRYQRGSRHPTVWCQDRGLDLLGGDTQQKYGTQPPNRGGRCIKNK